MSEASKARVDGSRAKERDIYRAAAAAYPARKEPWGRLADSYFEASDYGNAILAAQEVLQRDAVDPTANGLLAVSGLRVSTQALSELRNQKSITSDTRAQAEEIVRSLRATLGEPVLVPKPAEAVSVKPPKPPEPQSNKPRTPSPRTAATPRVTAPAGAAPPARPPSVKAAPPANPLDRLR